MDIYHLSIQWNIIQQYKRSISACNDKHTLKI